MRTAQWPVTAPPFRQPAPLPVLRLLWLGTPLPNLPVRAPAADAFTEVPLTDFTAGYCTASTAVLLTAAPDHRGPPGPVVSPVAVLRQPWLRNSTTAPPCELQLRDCCLAVHLCQALRSLCGTRETITTPPPNVYSDEHRFLFMRGRGTWPCSPQTILTAPAPTRPATNQRTRAATLPPRARRAAARDRGAVGVEAKEQAVITVKARRCRPDRLLRPPGAARPASRAARSAVAPQEVREQRGADGGCDVGRLIGRTACPVGNHLRTARPTTGRSTLKVPGVSRAPAPTRTSFPAIKTLGCPAGRLGDGSARRVEVGRPRLGP